MVQVSKSVSKKIAACEGAGIVSVYRSHSRVIRPTVTSVRLNFTVFMGIINVVRSILVRLPWHTIRVQVMLFSARSNLNVYSSE